MTQKDVEGLVEKRKREQFLNAEVVGCAGAILQLLYEKLPEKFDKWGDVLKLASGWLEGKDVESI